jgi:glycosyltransferase involved in cell wall biosynthesis
MRTTLLFAEDISEPIDEGIKKFSFHFAKFIDIDNNKVYCCFSNKNIHNIRYLPKNKFFFSLSFFKDVKLHDPRLIIYIPSSSSTLMSFIRLKIVSIISRSSKTIMVSVQARKHEYMTKILIATILKPDYIFALSNIQAVYYEKMRIKSFVCSSGVDVTKFNSILTSDKKKLRQKLGLPLDGKILLHVGHINTGRNLAILKVLLNEGFKLVIIGSTRFESDVKFKQGLEKEGYVFLNDYIENIVEYYQASDIYVFPVVSNNSAIEFPLSVLEAMSCNLPILTTRFGGLQNSFSESECFKYFTDKKELLEKANLLSKIKICKNREIVLKDYSWEIVFKNLLNKVN